MPIDLGQIHIYRECERNEKNSPIEIVLWSIQHGTHNNFSIAYFICNHNYIDTWFICEYGCIYLFCIHADGRIRVF